MGRWVMLQGIKQGKPVTIGIIDHPGNQPTAAAMNGFADEFAKSKTAL